MKILRLLTVYEKEGDKKQNYDTYVMTAKKDNVLIVIDKICMDLQAFLIKTIDSSESRITLYLRFNTPVEEKMFKNQVYLARTGYRNKDYSISKITADLRQFIKNRIVRDEINQKSVFTIGNTVGFKRTE